jgi:crossover junction endodeoxyribonuclease RusA
MTALFLPFPPSLNGLFKNRKGGRVKTDPYKLWIADAQESLLKQLRHKREHVGTVSIDLTLSPPNKARRDLDNTLKAIIDFLVSNKIIQEDDSRFVRRITAEWKEEMPVGCYVTVHDLVQCPTKHARNSIDDRLTVKPRRGK